MIKHVTWDSATVQTSELARWLTAYNFQPDKFHLIPTGLTGNMTMVIFVKEEL